MFNNRKLLHKIMVVTMVLVVASMVMALVAGAFIGTS